MKYLLVVCVVVVVLWLMLRPRKLQPPATRSAARPQDPQAQAMVQCLHCGVHLPRGEALVDARGAFCSRAHRLAGPGPH